MKQELDLVFRSSLFGGYNKEDVKMYVSKLESELRRLEVVAVMDDYKKGAVDAEDKEIHTDEKETAEFKKRISELESELDAKKKELEDVSAANAAPQTDDSGYKEKITALQAVIDSKDKEIGTLKLKAAQYDEDYAAVKNVLLNARVDAEIIIQKANEKARLILDSAQRRIEDKQKESVQTVVNYIDENKHGIEISRAYLEEQLKTLDRTEKVMKEIKENAAKAFEFKYSSMSDTPDKNDNV